jgi:hypothetical protein
MNSKDDTSPARNIVQISLSREAYRAMTVGEIVTDAESTVGPDRESQACWETPSKRRTSNDPR